MAEKPSSRVLQTPAAMPAVAHVHFAQKLALETDPWDVHQDQLNGVADFVLVDARDDKAYRARHLPGAIHLPHESIDASATQRFSKGKLLVLYCWGPYCNGATKAAVKLSALGFQVKEMIGGIDAWIHEGYPVETSQSEGQIV